MTDGASMEVEQVVGVLFEAILDRLTRGSAQFVQMGQRWPIKYAPVEI